MVAVNLANELARRGHQVELVVMENEGELRSRLEARIEVVNLRQTRFRSLLGPLCAYLRSARPHALIAFMWPLTVLAVVAGLLSLGKTRVIVTEHCNLAFERQRNGLARATLALSVHLVFPWASAIVAVSHGVARELSSLGRLPLERIRVIHNPVAATQSPSPQVCPPSPWRDAPQRLLAVGSLKEEKDYFTLLAALSVLRRTHPAVQLLILGEGRERARLEKEIERLNLGDCVEMPGFRENLTDYYAHADLLVLSSLSEGFGNVLVEALEQGTPVVSTDCPYGPTEILDGGRYGRLVPVGSPQALSEAIAATLAEPPEPLRMRSRAGQFSIAKAADGYEQLVLGAI